MRGRPIAVLTTTFAALALGACGGQATINEACGNGVIETGEVCDSGELAGEDCFSQGLASGNLACAAGCKNFDTSGCTDVVCGDGTAEGNEECDGGDLNDADCQSQGFVTGTLACDGDCEFDTTECTDVVCGNDVAEASEVCDGPDLRLEDCLTRGFDDGDLFCDTDCGGFDTTGCTGPGPICGNALIEGPEICDALNLGGEDCASRGFNLGQLICDADCAGFDTAGCSNAVCGDGVAEAPEPCDGGDLAGNNCLDLGFVSGALACHPTCERFDVDGCVGGALCGDEIAVADEACDGSDLRGEDCLSLGFDSGDLACDADCIDFDTAACTGTGPTCGNDLVEGGELCDGTDLDGVDCVDLGYNGGTPACTATCDGHDTAGCTGPGPVCGDSVIVSPEDCDGTLPAWATCVALGFHSGELGCDNCLFDYSGCSTQDVCGDGVAGGPEDCDGQDLAGETCESLGYFAGALACSGFCLWDTTGCRAAPECGDGIAEGNEPCDGVDLAGADCLSRGFPGGDLFCDTTCSFDTSSCLTQLCGNDLVEGSEVCDGGNLDGWSCADLSFGGGNLACAGDCNTFIVSGCVDGCGNDLREALELCDGVDLDGRSCQSIGSIDGTLLCDSTCTDLDISGCSGALPTSCGDGILNGLDLFCDGNDLSLPSDDCDTLGLGPGQITCNADCTFNLSGCLLSDACAAGGAYNDGACSPCELLGGRRDPDCATACANADGACSDVWYGGKWRCLELGLPDPDCGTCGNGIREDNEYCDGTDLGAPAISCVDFDFAGGAISCLPNCTPNFSNCQPPVCGNDLLEAGESCDNADLGGLGCGDFGFAGGVLACEGTCDAFDFDGCGGGCGNNLAEATEICDGTDTGPYDCADFGYQGGSLRCAQGCGWFDTAGCEPMVANSCGDGIANGTDFCDGDDFAFPRDCGAFAIGPGEITCRPDCLPDLSGCADDFCAVIGAYGNGVCDPFCEVLGGQPDDPECYLACLTSDGLCDDTLEGHEFTCLSRGIFDPDCTGTCGNNVTEDHEACDGIDIGGLECADFAYVGGPLACRDNCTFDFAGCVPPVCGNDIAEATEFCDGGDLRGHDCASVGMIAGPLGCRADCAAFDYSACEGAISTSCGDGVANGNDMCDGAGTFDCAELGLGNGPASCTPECTLDLSGCPGDFCAVFGLYGDGDCFNCPAFGGQIDPDCFAICDQDDLYCPDNYYGAWSCWGLGLPDLDCGTCGDDLLEGSEFCDGSVIPDDCASFGWASGDLSCRANCTYDFSACTAPSCGDDTREGWEQCDGADVNGFDCSDFGFAGGMLGCAGDCSDFDFSGCGGGCGNGLAEVGEICDGLDLGGLTCGGLGYAGGVLACPIGTCARVDTRGCNPWPSPHCGNGVVNGLEVCDGDDFGGNPSRCGELFLSGGELGCTSDCQLDLSACFGDFCLDLGLLGNGSCEGMCEGLGGFPDDPDCIDACNIAGDQCSDVFLIDDWTCRRRGLFDPDCGTCGNNVIEGNELCDGIDLSGDCVAYGFSGGDLGCLPNCVPDFAGCTL